MSSRKIEANIVDGIGLSGGEILNRSGLFERRIFVVMEKEFPDLTPQEALGTLDIIHGKLMRALIDAGQGG
jgi:hypothetical protein